MATKKGPGPAPLDPKVVKKLLDLLSTDNEFRRLFKKDAQAALVQAGYKPPKGPPFQPPGPPPVIPPVAGSCMQLRATDRIAPKAKIIRERAKLERSLNAVQQFEPLAGMKAD
jgi:putative modified peptide